jgi:Uma2 family endonuclease
VILGPPPPEVESLIESRRRTGADRYDEVWDGDLHVHPAPRNRHQLLESELHAILRPHAKRVGLHTLGGINIGGPDDFRIPDLAILVDADDRLWNSTAALVVEILSPHDETFAKLTFYADHHIDEVVIIDPVAHSATWLRRASDGRYEPVEQSTVLDAGVNHIAGEIDWPK